MNASVQCWVDGVANSGVPVNDRGLQYGDGVFRTTTIIDGTLLDRSGQLAHLRAEAEQLGLTADWSALDHELDVALADAGGPPAVLKVLLTRRQDGRGYRPQWPADSRRILMLGPAPRHPAACWTQGIRVCLLDSPRISHETSIPIKHLNRLVQVMAEHASPAGFDESLVANTAGRWACGTKGNLFVVAGDTLLTPGTGEGANGGRMRQRVLDCAHGLGFTAQASAVDTDVLKQAAEAFLTNSLIGIWPLRALCDVRGTMQEWDAPGPVTQRLIDALDHPWSRLCAGR